MKKLVRLMTLLVAVNTLVILDLVGQGYGPRFTLTMPRGATFAVAAEKAEPLDINSASEEQLKALPGIGDKYAFYIIKNRPYKRKDELAQKKIIPKATYDKIKDRIVVRQK